MVNVSYVKLYPRYFTGSFPSGNVTALRRKPKINHIGSFDLTELIHGGSIEHFDAIAFGEISMKNANSKCSPIYL
jgi:hypothetical protein